MNMREAYHVIDKIVERLPLTISPSEAATFKQLAKKGIYLCPYCQAELMVKSGELKEIHFSHKYSEACMESTVADKSEKKYRKQVARETPKHRTLVDIFIDELKITSKINPQVFVDYGYRAKMNLTQYPDIWLEINGAEIALSIVTNVNPNVDHKLAKEITKRQKYFLQKGMHPVWFIENKELAMEKEKNAIVLWEAEGSIALYTSEDRKWETALKSITRDLAFFHLFNYIPSMPELRIEVRSLYFVSSNDEGGISVQIQRFLKDRNEKPLRAFMLGDGYEISFAEALAVKEGRLNLSDSQMEERNRKQFIEKYQTLKKQKEEEERLKQELEKKRIKEQEKQLEWIHQQKIEDRKKQMEATKNVMSYNDLKVLLKKKINLTQSEQNELWSKYMLPKIGAKNSQLVWDLVEQNDVKSFEELKRML
jgi:hypothetical protein